MYSSFMGRSFTKVDAVLCVLWCSVLWCSVCPGPTERESTIYVAENMGSVVSV